MGIAVDGKGLSSPPCLKGFQRLIAAVTKAPAPGPPAPEIYLEFVFSKIPDPPYAAEPLIAPLPLFPITGLPNCPRQQYGFALSAGAAGLVGGPGEPPADRIVVKADLGSYRLRPVCGVNIFAPVGIWEVAMWHSYDPCPCDETLWWTRFVPPGPFVPDPYYHLLRILGGTVTYHGVPLVQGPEMSLPGSGANLIVGGDGAAVQLGFRI